MREELKRFDVSVPIERASTPPASWYVDPEFYDLERRSVFLRTWQAVGRVDQLTGTGDYISGDLAGEPYVVLRDRAGDLRAFLNVCRHHASCIVKGEGRTDQLVCPYHGWTYDLDGRLRKAPRMAGVQEFDREKLGLIPLDVSTWGPLVFVRIARDGTPLDVLMRPLDDRIDCSSLRFVTRVSYELACNWKVFVDNYLDGGYHVGQLHRGLASQLDLESYRTEIEGRILLQICGAEGRGQSADGVDFQQRIGDGAVYAFIYPNFMINRYGPVMDTNWVLPLGHERTLTVFDYYFDPSCTDDDPQFVERSLKASDRVQREDIEICESVQKGMGSSSFDRGRYAPAVEQAAHHFHCLLAGDLKR